MRRLLGTGAFTLVALMAAMPLGAQRADVGVKGGLVVPTLGGADVLDVKARTAFGGGAFVSVALTPVFAVQPEVLYVGKGAKETVDNVEAQLRLTYVEIPVLARINFPMSSSALRPHVFAGPAVAFKTGCSVKGSAGGFDVSGNCDTFEGAIKSTDLSVTGGAGLAFPLGPVSGLVEARYDYGLTKIDDTGLGADVKNRAFMAFVGFSVPLGQLKASTTRAR